MTFQVLPSLDLDQIQTEAGLETQINEPYLTLCEMPS